MGKWWLVTWTTFGTWLPGDPRGFQTWKGRRYIPPPKRYADPGERTYNRSEYAEEWKEAKQNSGEPVFLSETQQRLVLQAIVDEITTIKLVTAILSVEQAHVHLLAKFGTLEIRPTVGRIKAASTRVLHEQGLTASRLWSRNCHMKSKSTPHEFAGAMSYIRKHLEHGALIYIWPAFRDKKDMRFDL